MDTSKPAVPSSPSPTSAPGSSLLDFSPKALAGDQKSLMLASLDRPRRDRCEQIARDQLALFSKGDTVAMITYGSKAQSDLAQTSSALLGALKTRDTGPRQKS